MREDNTASRVIIRRKYAPKTRSGCATCKIRRIKCDEAKPCCKRCTSTGRKCDGYTSDTSSEATASPPESLQLALTVDVASDTLEKRTFDFFRAKTVPGISGYFSDSTWNRTVLQVSHSQPALRYAVNALGALHEEIFLRRKARKEGLSVTVDCRTSFPIRQYTKAIKEVQKLLKSENVPLDVVLLCSMAFMHFESLHESFLPALVHLENAIKMLKSSEASGGKAVDDGIVQAIRRMDVQGSMYLGLRKPGLPYHAADPEQPSRFRNLAHARDVVNTETCRLLYFMRTEADDYKFREPGNIPLEIYAKAQEFERSAVELERRLSIFMREVGDNSKVRERDGLDMLRSTVKTNRILAAVCLFAEVSAMDRFQDEFEEILNLCQYRIDHKDLDDCFFSASLDEGMLTPLWFVANNCRDSKIRHRALTLMNTLPAREGIWYVEVMTRIVEHTIRYEEALCEKADPTCADIPEWRRVHGSGLSAWEISSPRTSVRVHLRTRPNGMDGEWRDVQETIHFWMSMKQKDVVDFKGYSLPALTEVYPFQYEPLETLAKGMKWDLHTEPFMSALPFLMKEPAIS